MTEKLRLFVSSVQMELEDERLIVQNLVNTDPFLSAHTRETANQDFGRLLELGLSRRVGRGRSTHYVLGEAGPNRQGIVGRKRVIVRSTASAGRLENRQATVRRFV
jgi:hypothetical protein